MKALLVRILLVILSFILIIQLWIFGCLVWWRTHPVETTMFMRLDYWSEPSKAIKHQWRDYDDISQHLKKAVVTVEDGKFMHHHGFDWDGIKTALDRNKDKGKVVAGGSTISQQLAKNLFLYNKRSFVRKGQEAIATWMMERMWSKQRILEVYLNSVEFGDNIYGAEAAAKYYYGKSAKNLTRNESIFLASILTNPKYFQDNRNAKALKARKRMTDHYMRYAEIP